MSNFGNSSCVMTGGRIPTVRPGPRTGSVLPWPGEVSQSRRIDHHDLVATGQQQALVLHVTQDAADHLPDRSHVVGQFLLRDTGNHALTGRLGRRQVQQVAEHILPQRGQRRAGQGPDVGGGPFGRIGTFAGSTSRCARSTHRRGTQHHTVLWLIACKELLSTAAGRPWWRR